MVFLLCAASYKAQHPLKAGVQNTDMTFTRPWGMLAVDGVSGVADIGMEPAAFAEDFRNNVRYFLSRRNAGKDRPTPYGSTPKTSTQAFDKEVMEVMQIPKTMTVPALRRRPHREREKDPVRAIRSAPPLAPQASPS